jgi:hypothetical protein
MEQGMSVIHRVLRLGVLAVLAATVTGCIVLPYGARGRHHAVDRHHAAPSDGRPIMHEAPQQQPRRSR